MAAAEEGARCRPSAGELWGTASTGAAAERLQKLRRLCASVVDAEKALLRRAAENLEAAEARARTLLLGPQSRACSATVVPADAVAELQTAERELPGEDAGCVVMCQA